MNSIKLQYTKINTQKSLTFLDTNNERAEEETKETISCTIASKRTSLLEINLIYTRAKTRPGADCGSDHKFLIAKFRHKLQKVGETTRSFMHDLN